MRGDGEAEAVMVNDIVRLCEMMRNDIGNIDASRNKDDRTHTDHPLFYTH